MCYIPIFKGISESTLSDKDFTLWQVPSSSQSTALAIRKVDAVPVLLVTEETDVIVSSPPGHEDKESMSIPAQIALTSSCTISFSLCLAFVVIKKNCHQRNLKRRLSIDSIIFLESPMELK